MHCILVKPWKGNSMPGECLKGFSMEVTFSWSLWKMSQYLPCRNQFSLSSNKWSLKRQTAKLFIYVMYPCNHTFPSIFLATGILYVSDTTQQPFPLSPSTAPASLSPNSDKLFSAFFPQESTPLPYPKKKERKKGGREGRGREVQVSMKGVL